MLFLPGMSGRGEFWEPVASRMRAGGHRCTLLDWPGLGGVAARADVAGYDDLVRLVCAHLNGPTVLVGQSMGGYLAIRTALAAPGQISHLLLAATSGGLDMAALGADDWRPGSRAAHQAAPAWAFEPTSDLSDELRRLDVPTLLVWASADAISPVAVGLRLLQLLADARLLVLDSEDHWVARVHGDEVAAHLLTLLDRARSTP